MSQRLVYNQRQRIPDAVLKELDQIGLPWELKPGKRHFKLYVGGIMATIVPMTPSGERSCMDRKTIGCIRRAPSNRRATRVD